ncbi:hypothetical protein [Paraconexibacter sp. AEG42_29]
MARPKRQVQFWRSAARQPPAFQAVQMPWTGTVIAQWPPDQRRRFLVAFRRYVREVPSPTEAERVAFVAQWVADSRRRGTRLQMPSQHELSSFIARSSTSSKTASPARASAPIRKLTAQEKADAIHRARYPDSPTRGIAEPSPVVETTSSPLALRDLSVDDVAVTARWHGRDVVVEYCGPAGLSAVYFELQPAARHRRCPRKRAAGSQGGHVFKKADPGATCVVLTLVSKGFAGSFEIPVLGAAPEG